MLITDNRSPALRVLPLSASTIICLSSRNRTGYIVDLMIKLICTISL